MSISRAFGTAYKTVTAQKSETLRFLLTELALTLMCLAPLLFLTAEKPLSYLALLSVPLWLLVKNPARLNAAAAMQDSLGEGKIFSLRLADPGNYTGKVLYGIRHLVLQILWSAPAIAAAVYAWDQYTGDTDGLTVMQWVYEFGGKDTKTGLFYLLAIFAGLLLIAALGAGFHSGDRHAWVLEDRKVLKGAMRWYVLLCRLCTLVYLLPLIAAVLIAAWRYVPLLNDANSLLAGDVTMPSSRTTLLIVGIGAALSLPLIPLRSMVMATFVRGLKE